MVSSWTKFVSECKSRLSALARSCFLGRLHWFQKYQEAKQALEELRESLANSEARCGQLEQERGDLCRRISELQAELAKPHPIQLPLGDVPPGQHYGSNMVALCVNLAQTLGIRPAVRAVEIFCEWLGVGVEVKIPSHESVRVWMQRIGLGRIQEAKYKVGGTWIVDHTIQIGKEKVLIVLRVHSSPPPGVALRHQDVEVLGVYVGTEWKREDVAKVYDELAVRYGMPDALSTDGAVELREALGYMQTPGKKPRVFRDPKHFLANKLEAILNRDPNWEAFTQKIGRSRSALQQTELAHFVPPPFKTKARFMNLEPTIHWAATVLWHLDHPESISRKDVTAERMNEKLGWLREFATSIQQWQECQKVISTTLTFLNQQGIFRGVVKQYRQVIAGIATSTVSQQLVNDTEALLCECEKKLKPHERLRISTEILESGFARYKQLEKQHCKSGFTSLILTFPTLLRKTTAEEVTDCFARVKVADVQAWAKEHIPITLASRRQRMFREANQKPKRKPQKSAMPLSQAS